MGGGGSKNKITPQDRAILDLKVQRDKLKQYQKRLSVVLDRETEIARACLLRNDKPRALLALRKKKYQEKLLQQTDEQLNNLEQLTQSIEFALVEREVFRGLTQGNQVLKELHKEMSLENVERLMDETADALAYQREIDEMLGTKISDEDEAELEHELATLQAQEVMQTIPDMPQVPTRPLPEVSKARPQEEGDAESESETARVPLTA
ncbi:Vacuolar protein sorting-associated protein 20 [Tieghemiomyces parasiticus]|uniref:Vacuolar protein sorting-associated protein 20 n=1 Tax=Tieghemiomyces parasiticus TaxID=78921 RepID=A0A9W8AA73_9FUNG|nr:Vacuolar protein sorting-associated protein 20 [Tieghemiomyces parasiticus]